MRGHIIAETRFLHQGKDHHLFVTAIENTMDEYRFEVTCIPPGGTAAEAVYEKLIHFSEPLGQAPLDQLIGAELAIIQELVTADEDLHTHDP